MNPFNRSYQNLNRIEVNARALQHNYHHFQNQLEHALVAPVLKANAYGHGLGLVGQFVDQELRPPFICVDSLYEAYELQKAGVGDTPILIIGYTDPRNFSIWKKLPFSFPVYDEPTLKALNRHQAGATVHIKIDSGMNRLGLQPSQVPEFIQLLKKYRRVNVEGIYSHFSQADEPRGKQFTLNQVKAFKQAVRQFESAGFDFKWKHLAASAGSTLVDDPDFNLVRLGLGFYGISPFPPGAKPDKALAPKLKPALTLKTHLIQVKTITKGSQVSYGGTFTAKRRMRIAILPIGYYNGVDRRLSNLGIVRVGGTDCPIIGRVCMNLTIIDVSRVTDPQVGDETIVFSSRPKAKNNIVAAAKQAKVIPYELLVNLSETTKRILI